MSDKKIKPEDYEEPMTARDVNIRLKEELDKDTYDKVRVVLGLEPLSVAREKGMKQSQKILNTND